jgi:hypothetical protein
MYNKHGIFFLRYLRRLQEAAAAAANGQQDDGDASPSPVSSHQNISSPIQDKIRHRSWNHPYNRSLI